MKNRLRIICAILLTVMSSNPAECLAQQHSFNDLFKAAFNCNHCPDSVQIAMYDEAINAGISLTDDLHNFHNALVNRGQLLVENGNLKKAIEDFELALAVQPDEKYLYQTLGTTYLELGDYDAAIMNFNIFINSIEEERRSFEAEAENLNTDLHAALVREWNEQLAPAFNNKALAHAYKGKHSIACQYFKRAYDCGMHGLKSFLEENCSGF